MKKLLSVLLSAVMLALCLTACGESNNNIPSKSALSENEQTKDSKVENNIADNSSKSVLSENEQAIDSKVENSIADNSSKTVLSENEQAIDSKAENNIADNNTDKEYEKPLNNYIKSLESRDAELFVDSVTPKGPLATLGALSENSPKNQYQNRLNKLINKYGDDFDISYEIINITEMTSNETLGLVDKGYTLKVNFTVSGSKEKGSITKTVKALNSGGKWCLGSAPSLTT